MIIPLAAGLNPRPAYASAYLTQRNVVYNGAGQRLDVYKPAASGHANRPIVVLVHGGGWHEGSKEYLAAHAAFFASHNVTALTINYRLAPQHRFPAAFTDVRDAVSLCPHQRRNPEGRSQQDRSCRLLGGRQSLQRSPGCTTRSECGPWPAPRGIYDLPSGAAANPVWAGVIPQYMGPYHYGYGSPVNLVSRGDPPVLLVHGRQDSVVAPSQSSHMASRLEGELVPRLLRTYDGGHDMFYPGSPAYRAVMTDVLGFLLYWTSS